MPMSASAIAAIVAASRPWKKSAKTGSATSSASTRNASVASDFASQIAAVGTWREHGASSTRCSLRYECAPEPEQSREENRDPEQAAGGELRRARRKREVEDNEHRDDEQQHRGDRVPRPQLEQQVLRVTRERRRGSSCEREARRRERLDPLRVVGRDEKGAVAAKLGELCVEQLGALVVERRVRLIEHE